MATMRKVDAPEIKRVEPNILAFSSSSSSAHITWAATMTWARHAEIDSRAC